jgi:hypothetical protein
MVRPLGDGVDRPGQRSSLLRQRVFHADGRVRDDRPFDNPLLFELLKPFAEHPIGDRGDRLPQHGEPAARLEQHEDDGPGPSPADELARPMELGAQ